MGVSPNWFARTMRATMAQFDVHLNPVVSARASYPYVVAMQAEFAATAIEQIVAPMAVKNALIASPGRLIPSVTIEGYEHVVLVPNLTAMRTRDLGTRIGSVASSRAPLLAAIDYLFFGI